MLETEGKRSNHDSSERTESSAEGLEQCQCANAVPCLPQPTHPEDGVGLDG